MDKVIEKLSEMGVVNSYGDDFATRTFSIEKQGTLIIEFIED